MSLPSGKQQPPLPTSLVSVKQDAVILHFQKMNGAGNDFVLLDNRQADLQLSARQIVRLCDRHRGVGGDGLLLLEPPQNGADYRMRYFNSDGGEAEMCGNGARCFARFARQLTSSSENISFETPAGVMRASFEGELVSLGMGNPKNILLHHSLVRSETAALTVHSINTGVPHTVVFVDHLERVDVQALGSEIRWHSVFSPAGTNVNFVKKLSDHVIAVRTYERGVEAETLACGTGVVASALIHALVHSVNGPISVEVKGGEMMQVSFEKKDGHLRDVVLTGPAEFAFKGEIEL